MFKVLTSEKVTEELIEKLFLVLVTKHRSANNNNKKAEICKEIN